MKTTGFSWLRVVMPLLALLLSGPLSAATNLRMSNWFPQQHPLYADVLAPWAEAVQQATEGRVRVRIMKKTIGSVANQFDVIRTGQADIGFGNQAYSPGRFSQYKFVELPAMGDSAEATSVAYWRTYNRFLKAHDELSEIKVLGLFTSGPGQLFLRDPELNGLAPLAGLKIRGGGESSTRVVDLLGMTSIQAPFSKAAEMISNGVVDGAMFDRSVVAGVGFDRYFGNRLVYPGGLFNVSYFIGINLKRWNALSAEDQQAIEAISGEALSRKLGQVWDEQGALAERQFAAAGMRTLRLAGADQQRAEAQFAALEQQWVEEIQQRGLDGRAIIDFYRTEIANYPQH